MSRVHEQGCLLAVGCDNGSTSLLALNAGLTTSHQHEKAPVTAMFERETRMYKILEARNNYIS